MGSAHNAGALAEALAGLQGSSVRDESERRGLLRAMVKATRELETPIEMVLRIAWCEPTLITCVRIGINLKLFECLDEDNDAPKTCSQLAEKTGADPAFLGRVIRHLTSMGYIQEMGVDQYGPTPFTKAMKDPKVRDGICFSFDAAVPTLLKMPEFMKKTQYRNPEDANAGPFQFAFNVDEPLFDWLKTNPETGMHFNNHMMGYAQARPLWVNIYPVDERVVNGYDKNSGEPTLWVDIGGGNGQDVQRLVEKFPAAKQGKIVLQDMPHVIEGIKTLDESVERMGYDFFTPQPIHGARAYFMHSILHDWTDADCRKILTALRPALKRGYSKLLINELVVTDTGADPAGTALDWMVLAMLTSSERTEQRWKELLGDCGFKVTGIWNAPGGEGQAMIEAELA